ncbi:MAG TPA: CHAT domain-containing tetratricopeptide repeat protein [Vicinamibacterales bacterium]|nr:CHAT domain-containing tetratricopeptide repeat protein [Vicinamibacterales bacterium]
MLLFAWFAVVFAGCATTGGSPERLAAVKVLEAESAARLASEGQLLYESDTTKRNGYDYCGLAVGLIEQGQLRLGIREASKALFLGQSQGDRCLVAFAKRDLAVAYSFAGHVDRAQRYAEDALTDASRCRDPARVELVARKVLGDVHLRAGRPREALREYERIPRAGLGPDALVSLSIANAYLAAGDTKQAGELFRRVESPDATIGALAQRGLGQVALVEGRVDEAVRLFERAAGASRGSDAAYHRLWALAGLGRARARAGDRAGAVAAYRRSIVAAEEVRARFRSEELKSGFFGEVQQVFDEAIALLVESGDAEGALEVSERSRGRALQDLLRGRVQTKSGGEVLTEAVGPQVSLAEIRAAVPDGVVIVEYHNLTDRTYAWTIRRSGVVVTALGPGRDSLALEVRQLRRSIRDRASETAVVSRRLYDRLIRPLALRPGEDLVVVPHGALHYLPFQALMGDAGFLIEERGVSYLPAANTVRHFLTGPGPTRRRALALGNPDLGSPRLALPAAEREVEQLRGVFPETEVYVRQAATKQQLVRRAPVSEIIHVAAHAELDEIDPLHSAIRLAAGDGKSGDLEAHEVYELDLSRAGLVALSACSTGLGHVSRGDELWGFTRSFLAAGSRTLLVSLWPVADEATARLMARFYASLGKDGARGALRRAQLALLTEPTTRDPFFWAAFNAVGDWR